MRNFLPIKGPGGRNLTGKEKIALLVLVVTLLLCVLTLVAGERAYLLDEAPNPIFSIVAAFGSALGGGIVALYALIMVWSALIYLKGERVADVTPIVGRCAAAFAVTIGISGALGIAHLDAAGGLGDLVGRSLGNTFGAGAGFPILILLMLLGAHLASQGAWTALREPMMPALATAGSTLAPVGYGFGLAEAPESRLQDGPPLPDDGDPTADERSLAVQQAVAEIERSQGVTIVDVEPAEEAEEAEEAEHEDDEDAEAEAVGDETRSIGEEVHEAPEPDAGTEEAEVQRGLAAVAHALQVTQSAADDVETDEENQTEEEARYHSEKHGLVPVPVGEQPVETSEDEDEEDEDEFAEVEQYEDEEDEPYATAEVEDEEDEGDYEDEDGVHEDEFAQDDEELEEDDELEDEEDEGEYAEHDEEEADEDADEDADADEEEDEDEEYDGEYASEEDDDEEEDEEEADDGEYASEEALEEDEELEEDEDEDVDDEEHEQLELFDGEGATEVDDDEELADEDEEEAADEGEEDEPVLEATPPEPEPVETDTDTDPYAQGGLLRRLQAGGPQSGPAGDRPHTAFDWRGRPIK